ncbi:helix-turn-helix transcriptional regulator [Pseudogemmobacter sp. W21_MBD1_M6]|uniref:helix-turn-helix transcriptional regulator n=1 Tax=Pseudogemmobacter sp. W21_MBD1_M6 TaxID=3240271 RepID=UPI003F9A7A48
MTELVLEADRITPILSDLISRSELAAELQLTTETLCRWNTQRIGPVPTRIGRKVYYRRASVEQWLLAQEESVPPRQKRGRR